MKINQVVWDKIWVPTNPPKLVLFSAPMSCRSYSSAEVLVKKPSNGHRHCNCSMVCCSGKWNLPSYLTALPWVLVAGMWNVGVVVAPSPMMRISCGPLGLACSLKCAGAEDASSHWLVVGNIRWWLGTFFSFPCIGNPNWPMFWLKPLTSIPLIKERSRWSGYTEEANLDPTLGMHPSETPGSLPSWYHPLKFWGAPVPWGEQAAKSEVTLELLRNAEEKPLWKIPWPGRPGRPGRGMCVPRLSAWYGFVRKWMEKPRKTSGSCQ